MSNTKTKFEVINDFDEIINFIESEIDKKRQTSNVSGVGLLRTINKRLRSVKKSSAKIMKVRKKRVMKPGTGFMTPVGMSDEILEFTGWSKDDVKSRVDVSKFICKYIKDNELQNPENRRCIITDDALSKLLGIDTRKKNECDLTYCSMQKYLKTHYTKL